MVKELKFGPMISALRSVRGYSTFNRHHVRDLEDRTHGQTNEYSSDHGILMFDYFSSMVYSLLEKMILGQLVKKLSAVNPYPTAFPYGNGMVLHFYQQQESSTTKSVHKVINKGLKTYV